MSSHLLILPKDNRPPLTVGEITAQMIVIFSRHSEQCKSIGLSSNFLTMALEKGNWIEVESTSQLPSGSRMAYSWYVGDEKPGEVMAIIDDHPLWDELAEQISAQKLSFYYDIELSGGRPKGKLLFGLVASAIANLVGGIASFDGVWGLGHLHTVESSRLESILVEETW